mmetsp:Transcript_17107/g.34054  ORF Transcript_17107/g.34054 Transcript_17107/m.34054 type:complete len:119 (-) Transcript_17107:364-720(-)
MEMDVPMSCYQLLSILQDLVKRDGIYIKKEPLNPLAMIDVHKSGKKDFINKDHKHRRELIKRTENREAKYFQELKCYVDKRNQTDVTLLSTNTFTAEDGTERSTSIVTKAHLMHHVDY